MGGLKFFTLLGETTRFSVLGDGGSPSSTCQKFTHPSLTKKSPPVDFPHQIFITPPKAHPPLNNNSHVIAPKKNFIFSCSHCSCTIFILSSYFLCTQVILILVNVQYLQNVVFSFEKGLSGQNHSLLDSHHLIGKFSPGKIPIPPTP